MQKIRTAALKKQMPKMWKLQSTLIAAVVAIAFAVATWMAMPTFWELPLFFEVTGQPFAQQCSAGLLWLCSVLSQKEVLYLMIEVIVIIAVACLPSDEWVRFQNEA
jgi:ABC-type thiamin/hydroxymethylpyrimidine transport system permease subunit